MKRVIAWILTLALLVSGLPMETMAATVLSQAKGTSEGIQESNVAQQPAAVEGIIPAEEMQMPQTAITITPQATQYETTLTGAVTDDKGTGIPGVAVCILVLRKAR